jgi:Domain of unknown function (DUF397)
VLQTEGQISRRPISSRGATAGPADIAGASWRKSSWSAANGSCVEVAHLPRVTLVAVRDTKDQERGPVLIFAQPHWESFLYAVKLGEFDIT